MIEKTKQYAIRCHSEVNHYYDYDGQPYSVHLEMVYSIGQRFIHLVPKENRDNVLAACWAHDVIEDCRQTYNDVRSATNESVADLVYALTNEKGKNRKERGGSAYYSGIIGTPFAAYVKICDRISNVQYSKNTGSRMFDMYKNENRDFELKLYTDTYKEMFDHLLTIFYSK